MRVQCRLVNRERTCAYEFASTPALSSRRRLRCPTWTPAQMATDYVGADGKSATRDFMRTFKVDAIGERTSRFHWRG